MNTLCDQLITEMTTEQQSNALLTGIDAFNTLKEAKPLAEKAGQTRKGAIAWNRNGEWLVFTFKKDEDCESGWAITARWKADKPEWIAAPVKPATKYKSMLIPIDRVADVAALLNHKEVAS